MFDLIHIALFNQKNRESFPKPVRNPKPCLKDHVRSAWRAFAIARQDPVVKAPDKHARYMWRLRNTCEQSGVLQAAFETFMKSQTLIIKMSRIP